MLILEQFVEAVRAQLVAANICGGAVTKNLGTPSEDARLPCADVFVAADSGHPDGDARTGIPNFVHTTKLVVEITDRANCGAELKAKLCASAEAALTTLLGNRAWGCDVLEGIGGIAQTYNQPPEGLTVMGAVQLQIDLLWRSSWPSVAVSQLPAFGTLAVSTPAGPAARITLPSE